MSEGNRTQELVQELFGAQMLAKVLDEARSSMRPEMKAEIAESIGQAALAKLKDDAARGGSFGEVSRQLDQMVARVLEEDRADVLRAAVLRAVDMRWVEMEKGLEATVKRIFDTWFNNRNVGEAVADAFRQRIKAVLGA